MVKFIIRLSNSGGKNYELYADIKEEEVEEMKKKIKDNFHISGTYAHSCAGRNYSAKDPKILEQLKEITGYYFSAYEPDVVLSYSRETFDVPGYIE